MSPTELLAYQYIKNNPAIGALKVATFLNSNYAYIRTVLANMAYRGLIKNKSTNGKRAQYYIDKRRKIQ